MDSEMANLTYAKYLNVGSVFFLKEIITRGDGNVKVDVDTIGVCIAINGQGKVVVFNGGVVMILLSVCKIEMF